MFQISTTLILNLPTLVLSLLILYLLLSPILQYTAIEFQLCCFISKPVVVVLDLLY